MEQYHFYLGLSLIQFLLCNNHIKPYSNCRKKKKIITSCIIKRVLALIKKKKKKKESFSFVCKWAGSQKTQNPSSGTVVDNCYKGPITWMGLIIKALQEETLWWWISLGALWWRYKAQYNMFRKLDFTLFLGL